MMVGWIAPCVAWIVGVAPASAPAPAPAPAPDPAANEDGNGAPTTSDTPPPSLPPPSGADGSVDQEVAEPATSEAEEEDTPPAAPLPTRAPAPPQESEPHAWGGAYDTPLPDPPEAEDPATLVDDPWRGRFWLGVGLHVSIPMGGTSPARGAVVAPEPELTFGWRVRPFVSLRTAVTNYAHDAAITEVADGAGGTVQEVVYGRMTAIEVLTARFYVPRPRKVEPWAEAGAGVGAYLGPIAARREAAGLFRVGAGLDLWLAPSLSLGPTIAYRVTLIGKAVGHGLRAGLVLDIHW